MPEDRWRRVLLVEDTEVNQALAVAILAKLGYRADVAGNAGRRWRRWRSKEDRERCLAAGQIHPTPASRCLGRSHIQVAVHLAHDLRHLDHPSGQLQALAPCGGRPRAGNDTTGAGEPASPCATADPAMARARARVSPTEPATP
jgi:hypothetical protein